MHEIIIADTSCLIILSRLGKLELLHKLYDQVTITQEIASEFGESLPVWIKTEAVTDKYRQLLLEMQTDKGEASAIALALEKTGSILILDDYRARRIADRLGLKFTGTIGVLIKAKHQGIIPLVKPLIENMKQNGFRLSPEMESIALAEANE